MFSIASSGKEKGVAPKICRSYYLSDFYSYQWRRYCPEGNSRQGMHIAFYDIGNISAIKSVSSNETGVNIMATGT